MQTGNLAFAIEPSREPVETGLGGLWDEERRLFIVPFQDHMTAEECLRIMRGRLLRTPTPEDHDD